MSHQIQQIKGPYSYIDLLYTTIIMIILEQISVFIIQPLFTLLAFDLGISCAVGVISMFRENLYITDKINNSLIESIKR